MASTAKPRATFWDRQAKRFDESPDDNQATLEHVRTHLRPDDHVLEIGCATGHIAEALSPHVRSWHGIDISAEMIRRAQARATDQRTFEQAVVTDPTLDGRTFTAVVALNVLHFMDLERDLDRIAGLLAPGGHLITCTPCLGEYPTIVRLAFPVLARVLRLNDLHRLRFQDLEHTIGQRFALIESDGRNRDGAWIVGRKTD